MIATLVDGDQVSQRRRCHLPAWHWVLRLDGETRCFVDAQWQFRDHGGRVEQHTKVGIVGQRQPLHAHRIDLDGVGPDAVGVHRRQHRVGGLADG